MPLKFALSSAVEPALLLSRFRSISVEWLPER
jgi:hypothetical protein